MAKLTLSDLASLANQTSAMATINANNALIEAAVENTLSLDGTTPNAMEAPLDMNSNRILNLPEPISENEPVRLQDMAGTIEVIDNLTVFGAELLTADDASEARTTLGLTSAATTAIGTSGATIPLLNGTNTHSGVNTFSNTTESTSTASGAIVTAGGLGVAKDAFFGDDVNVADALTVTGLTTLTGKAVLGAGSTSVAPLVFTSGTNLTTAAAGAKEYDGTAFYNSPAASNRGVDMTEYFLSLSSNQTGTDVNTAQPWFPGGGATGLNVLASTAYFFEGVLSASRTAGTTSHTIGMNFGGSATITSIAYWAHITQSDTATWSANGSGSGTYQEVATNVTLNFTASTSANQVFVIRVSGIVRVNAAGTFIPNFQYSAAPGGAPTIRANSWFKMRPVGTNSVLSVGNWS